MALLSFLHNSSAGFLLFEDLIWKIERAPAALIDDAFMSLRAFG